MPRAARRSPAPSGRFSVVQEIVFAYGHRLRDYKGKCRHPHGHNARVEVEIEGPLDPRGMVVDFGDAKRVLKDWIAGNLDHAMILRRDDPLARILRSLREPVFVMDQNPTAENLARLLCERGRLLGLRVSGVRFWEMPGACARYRP